ncbi:MAG: ribosome recycling factor [Elusimicrobiota bacterium]
MNNTILNDCKVRMEKSIESLKKELMKLRSGRAHSSLVSDIKVDYYGTLTPLKQLSNITVPEPKLIVIQPYDKSILGAVEKAIQSADIGINPHNDGNFIRLPIPPLSEETRNDLAKQIKKVGEENKISLRSTRRDCNEKIKEAEKKKEITEDQRKRMLDEVQKMTDNYVKMVDDIISKKESEIKQV